MDIGSDDELLIADGWHGAERDGSLTFRWASSPATVLIPLDHAANLTVQVRMQAFNYPGAVPQTMNAYVNGQLVTTTLVVPAEWTTSSSSRRRASGKRGEPAQARVRARNPPCGRGVRRRWTPAAQPPWIMCGCRPGDFLRPRPRPWPAPATRAPEPRLRPTTARVPPRAPRPCHRPGRYSTLTSVRRRNPASHSLISSARRSASRASRASSRDLGERPQRAAAGEIALRARGSTAGSRRRRARAGSRTAAEGTSGSGGRRAPRAAAGRPSCPTRAGSRPCARRSRRAGRSSLTAASISPSEGSGGPYRSTSISISRRSISRSSAPWSRSVPVGSATSCSRIAASASVCRISPPLTTARIRSITSARPVDRLPRISASITQHRLRLAP